jgi:hypothetical protein
LPEFLLWYDINAHRLKANSVKPFNIPMGSNSEYGTVVRDFKFTGKLPSDITSIAYMVNSNAAGVSESSIAPYVSFMYSANTIKRSGAHESIDVLITEEELATLRANYKKTHELYVKELLEARTKFGANPKDLESRTALAQALRKYIQYPRPKITQSSQLLAPVIPFDVEFTIDGINGFRYGDIIQFSGLPSRYRTNAVFPVIGVTHAVSNDGTWTTAVRCIMRSAIED